MKSLFKVSLVMLAFAGFMLHSGSVNAQSTCNVPEKYCVINTSDDGNIGSLRYALTQAIDDANNNGADVVIEFNVIGGSPDNLVVLTNNMPIVNLSDGSLIVKPYNDLTDQGVHCNNGNTLFDLDVESESSFTLNDLTISDGSSGGTPIVLYGYNITIEICSFINHGQSIYFYVVNNTKISSKN